MTLLDRALTKAYSRRSNAAPAESDPLAAAPVTKGWVARLRPPSHAQQTLRATPPETGAQPAVQTGKLIRAVDVRKSVEESVARTPVTELIPPAVDKQPVVQPVLPVVWSWPAICDRLLGSVAGSGLRGLGSLLREMLAERRQRSLAFTGPGRGAGRSSTLLTIARLLVEDHNQRVLVVDLDFGNPQLAQLLGIVPEHDLWQAASTTSGAATPLLTLIPDRLSLAPLRERVLMTDVTPERAAALRAMMLKWRREFDVVLVDGGPWELFGSLVVRETSTVEACVCVTLADKAASGAVDGERYRHAGMDFFGFIETFAPSDAQPATSLTR